MVTILVNQGYLSAYVVGGSGSKLDLRSIARGGQGNWSPQNVTRQSWEGNKTAGTSKIAKRKIVRKKKKRAWRGWAGVERKAP